MEKIRIYSVQSIYDCDEEFDESRYSIESYKCRTYCKAEDEPAETYKYFITNKETENGVEEFELISERYRVLWKIPENEFDHNFKDYEPHIYKIPRIVLNVSDKEHYELLFPNNDAKNKALNYIENNISCECKHYPIELVKQDNIYEDKYAHLKFATIDDLNKTWKLKDWQI